MKAQFFIISSVIIIYVIVLTFQYMTGFSDIRLSGVEEHQELSYISNVKNSFIQTLSTSNISNNGDMNKIVKDIDFTKNFFKQELLKKGIDFDSKFILFSNGFETGDFSQWTGVGYGTPQIVNDTVKDGSYSLYSNGINYVYEKLPVVNGVYTRVYVNFKKLPSNDERPCFIGFYNDTSELLVFCLWNDQGNYRLRVYFDDPVWNWVNSSPISIGEGEWHYFEMYWYENGTNSTIKAWYDGNIEINQTIDSKGCGKSISNYGFGAVSKKGGIGGPGEPPDLYIDCAAISSDYVGDKCYPDEQNYFDFIMKTNGLYTETEFPYQECSDGTLYGSCSATKPLYCSSGTLISSCSQCGCPLGQACQLDGTCTFAIVPSLQIQFVNPTDNDGAAVGRNWSYVNVSITDASSTSSFIDWNRSLVGYWSMDWYNSNGVYDNSTNGIFCNFSGGMSASDITTGVYGNGINGNTMKSLNCGNSSMLNSPRTAITLETWVKLNTLNQAYGWPRVIEKGHWSGTDLTNYYIIFVNSTDQFQFGFSNDNDGGDWITTTKTNWVAGNWYHLAITYDKNAGSNNLKFYVNGVVDATATYTDFINNYTYPLMILLNEPGSNLGINGSVDEVRVLNRALSPEEINASYNSGINRLYHNFTNLANGVYQYYAYAIDTAGNAKKTETRSITLSPFNDVLWSKFNEGLGTTAFDSSSYHNDGTYYGETFNDGTFYGETFNDGTLGNGTAGTQPTRLSGSSCMYGNCLGFDGTSSVIADVVNATDIPSGSLTVMAWIYPKQILGDERAIVSKWSNAAGDEWILRLTNADPSNLDFYIVNSSYGSEEVVSSSAGITNNTWQHVAITYDRPNKQVTFYVNGTQKGPVKTFPYNGQMVDSSRIIRIGAQGGGTLDPFNGTIDEVRIWNRTLSQAEIQAEMNSSMPVSRPIASYRFEEPASATYVNDTHTRVNGTYGSALSFDGVSDYVKVPLSSDVDFGDQDFSIGFWMKGGYQAKIGYLFSKNFIPAEYDSWYGCGLVGLSDLNAIGRIRCWLNQSNTHLELETDNNIYNDTAWHYITLVRNTTSNRILIYGDDVLHANTSDYLGSISNMTVAPQNNLFIGARSELGTGSNARYFNGTIDEFRIWNKSLNQTEINAERQSSLPISRTNAAWSFEEPASATYVNDTHIWVNGTYGSALSFDGANDYIDYGNKEIFNVQAITITAWVKIFKHGWNGILQKENYLYNGYWFGTSSDSHPYLYLWSGGTIRSQYGGVDITDGLWHFVAVTYDGYKVNYYLDSSSINYTYDYGSYLPIGASTNSLLVSEQQNTLGGIIDEVRIWSRALSPTEIQAEMYKG